MPFEVVHGESRDRVQPWLWLARLRRGLRTGRSTSATQSSRQRTIALRWTPFLSASSRASWLSFSEMRHPRPTPVGRRREKSKTVCMEFSRVNLGGTHICAEGDD